jgi:hypothetical protein
MMHDLGMLQLYIVVLLGCLAMAISEWVSHQDDQP